MDEALNQLSRLDPALAKRVSDYQQIISFRNILIHGYADVDDELVWDIVETRLPILRNEIAQIIAENRLAAREQRRSIYSSPADVLYF